VGNSLSEILKSVNNIIEKVDNIMTMNDAEQQIHVPINSPQKATKEDHKMRYAQDIPIDSRTLVNKGLDATYEELQTAKEIGNKIHVDWNKIDLTEFAIGFREEHEHKDILGSDEDIAKVALKHLEENKIYYTKLKKVGLIEKEANNNTTERSGVTEDVFDREHGHNRLGETQEPIVSKAAYSPEAPKQSMTEESDPIYGEEQHEVVHKLLDVNKSTHLIPVLSIIHYKSGKVKTSIRWKNPESIGVKNVESKHELIGVIPVTEGPYFTHSSKVHQTVFFLADSIDLSKLYNNELLPTDEHEKYGEGIYVFNSLDRVKEKNEEEDKTILPAKVNIQTPYLFVNETNWNEDFKNNLVNLGYDSIVISTGKPQEYDIFIFSPRQVRILGEDK
jgi:hypothetical protein